jgi:hypothetical protein
MIRNLLYPGSGFSPKSLLGILRNLLIPALLAFLILPSFAHAAWNLPPQTKDWFNISINNTGTNAIPIGAEISYTFDTATPDAYAQNVFTDWDIFNGITGNVLVDWSGFRNINNTDLFSQGHAKILKIWFSLPMSIEPGNAENVLSVAYLTTVANITYNNTTPANITNGTIQCINAQNNTCFYSLNKIDNSSGSPCISDPNATYCIPLEIYNNQTSIAANTQIALWFNPSNAMWSSYLSNDLGNMCIYDSATGNCMYSWMEGDISNPYNRSNFTALNRSILYWVKLENALPSGMSSNVFYIKIFNKSTDLYSKNGSLGANPDLYCNYGCPSKYYGQNDNGKYVFNLYDNFAGNYTNNDAVTGNIDNTTSAQESDWIVNNGLIFSGAENCGACGYVYISGGKYALLNSTEDLAFDADITPFYGDLVQDCVGFDGGCTVSLGTCYYPSGTIGFYNFNPSSETQVNSIDMGALVDTSTGCVGNSGTPMPQQDYLYSNNGVGVISRAVFQPDPELPYTLVLQNGYISVQNQYNNSNIYTNKTTEYPAFADDDVFAISNSWIYSDGWTGHTDMIQWIRVRTPPPNNVQPSIEFGQIIGKSSQQTNYSLSNPSETFWCRYCYTNYNTSTSNLETEPIQNETNTTIQSNITKKDPDSNSTRINNDTVPPNPLNNETNHTINSGGTGSGSPGQEPSGLNVVQSAGGPPAAQQNQITTTIAQETNTPKTNQSKITYFNSSKGNQNTTAQETPIIKSNTINTTTSIITTSTITTTIYQSITKSTTSHIPIYWLFLMLLIILSAIAVSLYNLRAKKREKEFA